MPINWVPKKNININLVAKLLNNSQEVNHFTNNGPNVQYLENVIRDKLQINDDKAIICVTNGSAALHALAAAIHDHLNQELNWATQSFTFPPSAQCTLSNASIIDIDDGGGIDLDKLPNAIDGIIVTNIFGNVVDIDKYTQWSKDNNKIVVYDNAATAYTFYKGINACNYGTGCTISFHHTKPIGFGEGGAIIVDKKYEPNVRRIINFGLDNNAVWNKNASNYKMSDIAAVYILQYLESFDTIITKHYELYNKLQTLLKNTDIKMYPNFSDSTPFLSCFCLLSPKFTINLVNKLLEKGIFCRKYYNPLKNTPTAIQIYDQILCIPCTVDMNDNDLDYIVNIILQNF